MKPLAGRREEGERPSSDNKSRRGQMKRKHGHDHIKSGLNNIHHSTSGLVVKFALAMREPRVRFTASANFFLWRSAHKPQNTP